MSLKIKIVLYLVPVFFILASAVNYAVFRYYAYQFKETLQSEQFQLVSRLAAEIDDKLAHARDSLVSQTGNITPAIVNDPAAAERYLDSLPVMRLIFDNNFLLFDAKGRLIAETAQRPSRTGEDFSYREYIRQTLETGRPFISKPFASTLQHRHPVVMFTAPVRDASGRIIAILAGSVDLLRNNFLGKLAQAKVGKGGYFYLYGQDRTMVMHPVSDRIMKQDVPLGKNRLFDAAIKGFEGAGETVTSRGNHVLAAFKHLETADWILAANYPIDEVYAPARRAEQVGWWIVAVGGLLVTLLVALAMRRLMQPLFSLKNQVVASRRGEHAGPISVATTDEIHQLAVEFNSLVDDLHIREEKLQYASELFQLIADTSESWVFWKTPGGEDVYLSPAAERITGYSLAELITMTNSLEGLIHPDDRAAWNHHVQQASCGTGEPLEIRIITKSGDERWIRHNCRPIRDGNNKVIGIRGSNTDITARKHSEEKLQHMSVHDALTGLYNRMYFDAELERLGRGRHFPVGIVVADIDNLKIVNDTRGHALGDELIRTAANLLGWAFRQDDAVCRIGGDEFAVLLPGADEKTVAAAIDRVRNLLTDADSVGDLPLGISLGGTCAHASAELSEALIRADRLMYEDKQINKKARAMATACNA